MVEHDEDAWVRELGESYRRPVRVDPRARERLLEAIRAQPTPRSSRRPFAWLFEARTLALPPAALAAAGLVLCVLGGLLGVQYARHADGLRATGAGAVVRASSAAASSVRFVLVAPQATRVSVVGDFNGWDRNATPMSRTSPDAPWTAAASIPPGRHLYAFVVDGERWIADPTAPLAPEDGFGLQNSVLVVRSGGST